MPFLVLNVYGEESISLDISDDRSIGSPQPNGASSTCEAGNTFSLSTSPRVAIDEATSTSGKCTISVFIFPVDIIPDGSTVTGASVEYSIDNTNNNGGPIQKTCDWKHLEFTTNGNVGYYDAFALDVGAVTDILQNTSSCQNPIGSTIDIFDTGNFKQLFEDDINGDNEIILGLAFTDMTRGQYSKNLNIDNDGAILTITYIPPLQYQIDELESRITINENSTAQNTSDILSLKSFIDSLIILLESFSTALTN